MFFGFTRSTARSPPVARRTALRRWFSSRCTVGGALAPAWVGRSRGQKDRIDLDPTIDYHNHDLGRSFSLKTHLEVTGGLQKILVLVAEGRHPLGPTARERESDGPFESLATLRLQVGVNAA